MLFKTFWRSLCILSHVEFKIRQGTLNGTISFNTGIVPNLKGFKFIKFRGYPNEKLHLLLEVGLLFMGLLCTPHIVNKPTVLAVLDTNCSSSGFRGYDITHTILPQQFGNRTNSQLFLIIRGIVVKRQKLNGSGMNDIKLLKEQQKDKHPGFSSYLECATRSLFSGMVAFSLGFSGSYFIQKIVQKRYPAYPIKFSILVSALLGCGVSYKVTSEQMFACQAKWMATEEKYFPNLK